MKEQIFTVDDIKDFMQEVINLRWYGKVFDGIQYRDATIKDFDRIRSWRFQCKSMKNSDLGLLDVIAVVTESTFRVLSKGDYSAEWQEFCKQKMKLTEYLTITR